MTPPRRIIHLDPAGPGGAGLQPLDLDPADFQSPLPVQNYHVYHEDQTLGLSVGIWDTTTMQEAFGPYPTDEFILVTEGAFAMVDGTGGAVTASAGDSVCFRQGTPTSWKQDGYLRKIYLTLADPAADMPARASAVGGVVVLAPPPPGEDQEAELFRNDTGTLRVHHIAAGALGGPPTAAAPETAPEAALHLVQVLTGSVTVREPSGAGQVFLPGQVFLAPPGTDRSCTASADFTAYRVTVHPPQR